MQLAFALVLVVGAIAPLEALAGNDKFSGVWKRNIAESEWRQELYPQTLTVEVKGDDVAVRSVEERPDGPRTFEVTYTPGETEIEQPGRTLTSIKWKGSKLQFRFKHRAGSMDAETVETWKVKGKNKLEVKFSTRLPVGTFVQRHVYDRAE